MAKKKKGKRDELFDLARASGLRKRVARTIADAQGAGRGGKRKADSAIANMRTMLDELEDRATGGPQKRREAALKAARTRRRNAAKRSEAAKKGAKTRAKS